MRSTTYDVVIVGSGPTGGYAAKALSEAGMEVLVLDAGPPRRASAAAHLIDRAKRRLGYVIEEDPAAIRRQKIQSACYAWPEHPRAFVDDLENPYRAHHDQPFAWIRSRQIGGRMAVRGHGLQFYRFSDLDFRCGDRDGASDSWPIGYDDLERYYNRIELWMGLRGMRDGIPQLPDPVTHCPKILNAGEQRLKRAIEATWKDRRLIACRTAAPPMPILDALATGKCTLRSNAIASRVLVNPADGKARGVRFVDRTTRQPRDVNARVVVLCASAIESARLLLLSATRQHPAGLGNSSDVVGRYLMDHVYVGGMNANMPLTAPEHSTARSWSYIPRFQNLCGRAAPLLRGYGIQVFTLRDQCAFTLFGEMLPRADNRVTIDPELRDAWGIPAAAIRCSHGENERAMAEQQIDAALEIFEAAGFEPWRVAYAASAPGLANHEMGTVRMGSDPQSSALNGFCQSWDVNNLFVMDGSAFVSQGAQNPTLTMMAIAARSCDYLIDQYRRGEI